MELWCELIKQTDSKLIDFLMQIIKIIKYQNLIMKEITWKLEIMINSRK